MEGIARARGQAMSLLSELSEIQFLLDTLARQHKVPGASLGILQDDRVVELATGVANVRTGVRATTDTLFQIGSNTKVYTATMVMQFVDDGLVDLDAPVRSYVPEFTLTDADIADAITVRQLISHSSGIPGDYFADFGAGDEAIERYVASLEAFDPAHDPGEIFSYSNAAFCVAGRLIENIAGKPYSEVLREKLLDPLHLLHTTVVPDEMLAFRVAAGHLVLPPEMATMAQAMPMLQPLLQLVPMGEPIMSPLVTMGRSATPAGSRTASTPGDVLAFVRMHLDGGLGPGGRRILSPDAVELMQTPQFSVPPSTTASPDGAIGLSWVLGTWDSQRTIGHGGGTIGQISMLQVLPDERLAVCLLTNCMTGPLLWFDLGRHLFAELAGVQMPELPKPPAVPADVELTPYAGRYESVSAIIDATCSDGKITITMSPKPGVGPPSAAALPMGQQMTLVAIDEERFYGQGPGGGGYVAFLERDADGRPKFLHAGGRACRRVS